MGGCGWGFRGGGVQKGRLGGEVWHKASVGEGDLGGAIWERGGKCPQGQALVNQWLPLPPLALPLTIPPP